VKLKLAVNIRKGKALEAAAIKEEEEETKD
jgi:hypothetical protein